MGTGQIQKEDLVFNEETVVTQDIEGSLYSDFESEKSEIEDNADEDTDWENYEKDVTFARKGKAKNMFKKHIVDEAIQHGSEELRQMFKKYGQLKIKPKDVPEELNQNEIEFRNEGIKNDSGDVYVGEFRK